MLAKNKEFINLNNKKRSQWSDTIASAAKALLHKVINTNTLFKIKVKRQVSIKRFANNINPVWQKRAKTR